MRGFIKKTEPNGIIKHDLENNLYLIAMKRVLFDNNEKYILRNGCSLNIRFYEENNYLHTIVVLLDKKGVAIYTLGFKKKLKSKIAEMTMLSKKKLIFQSLNLFSAERYYEKMFASFCNFPEAEIRYVLSQEAHGVVFELNETLHETKQKTKLLKK